MFSLLLLSLFQSRKKRGGGSVNLSCGNPPLFALINCVMPGCEERFVTDGTDTKLAHSNIQHPREVERDLNCRETEQERAGCVKQEERTRERKTSTQGKLKESI